MSPGWPELPPSENESEFGSHTPEPTPEAAAPIATEITAAVTAMEIDTPAPPASNEPATNGNTTDKATPSTTDAPSAHVDSSGGIPKKDSMDVDKTLNARKTSNAGKTFNAEKGKVPVPLRRGRWSASSEVSDMVTHAPLQGKARRELNRKFKALSAELGVGGGDLIDLTESNAEDNNPAIASANATVPALVLPTTGPIPEFKQYLEFRHGVGRPAQSPAPPVIPGGSSYEGGKKDTSRTAFEILEHNLRKHYGSIDDGTGDKYTMNDEIVASISPNGPEATGKLTSVTVESGRTKISARMKPETTLTIEESKYSSKFNCEYPCPRGVVSLPPLTHS
jgi:hypothetical protein